MAQLLSNILFANNALLLDSVSITASASQTIFNASYTAPFVEVYLNGVKLIKDTDYTAANGSAVVLTSAAANNDVVEVVKLKAGNIYGVSSVIAGTNISGGGSLSGGASVTLNLDSSLVSLTSVQSETLTNASGNLLVDSASQKTEFRGDGSSTVGAIQLNCEINTHGQTIKPQPHSESVTNELTLPAGGNQELVGTTATQTLTNKTLSGGTVTGGTVSPNSLTVANTATFNGDVIFNTRLKERVTVQATAASGTVNFNAIDSGVLYYTTAATGNWTLNIRGDASTDLDSIMDSGQTLSVVFLATNGAQNWRQSNTHIDGSYRNVYWQGASEPTGANNSIESYAITVVKTAANTFTVLGAKTQFQRTDLN